MIVVCDASVVVAALVDAGPAGEWAPGRVAGGRPAAPDILRAEAARLLEYHERTGRLTPDQAAQAHADLLALPLETWPYELLAERAWRLRSRIPVHDACCVALAELLDAPLVTLDASLVRPGGTACAVLHPGGRTPAEHP